MLVGLQNLVLSSRLWLTAGVLFLGASIFVGYHQDQMDAETALAQKIELPERVLVQSFVAQKDQNALGEVRILAEADFDRVVRIDVGMEGAAQLVDLVPIYPASREAFSEINRLGKAKRRPMPRAAAPTIAKVYEDLARIEVVPVGLLFVKAAASSQASELDDLHIGYGANGPLLDLTGKRLEAVAIPEQAIDALAQKDVVLIENAIVVVPYAEGRTSVAGVRDLAALQNVLFWTSILMLGLGSCLMVSNVQTPNRRNVKDRPNNVKAVGAFPAVNPFQPIAGQDEIGEENAEHRSQKASRVMTVATSVFRSKSRP